MRSLKEYLSEQKWSAVPESKHLDNNISLMKNKEGTQGKMIWSYFEVMPALLAMVSAVRETVFKDT